MPEDREWDPTLLGLRRQIERRFEAELRDATNETLAGIPEGGDVGQQLLDLAAADDGPSVASFLQRHATREQLQDYPTEHQSRWAAELLPQLPAGDVLELCSGAGYIGLLAVVESGRRLVAVDVNPVAGEFMVRNAAAAGLTDRLEMRIGRTPTS